MAGIRTDDDHLNRTDPPATGRTIIKPAWLTNPTPSPAHSSAPPTNSGATPAPPQTLPSGKPSCSSTPAEKTNKRKVTKRKNSSSDTPADRRLRPRTTACTPGSETDVETIELGEDTEMADGRKDDGLAAELKKYMKEQLDDLRGDLKTDVREAVSKIGEQVQKNTKNIEDLNNNLDSKIKASVAATVSLEMKKFRSAGPASSDFNRKEEDYWRARRSLRVWPIRCNDSDLWGSVGDFFHKILNIPTENLSQESVEYIRRIRSPRSNRQQKIQHEVLVSFGEVSVRDMVYSYAANLARHKQLPSPPGIRIEFPDHLRGAFSTLERYGAHLRKTLGPELKQSIKFDDAVLNLRIDVLFPGDEKWSRIPLDIATEEMNRCQNEEMAATRVRIDSLSSSSAITTDDDPTPGPSRSLTQSSTLMRKTNPNPPARWGRNL